MRHDATQYDAPRSDAMRRAINTIFQDAHAAWRLQYREARRLLDIERRRGQEKKTSRPTTRRQRRRPPRAGGLQILDDQMRISTISLRSLQYFSATP